MENQEQDNTLPEGYKLGAVQYFTGNAYVKMFVLPELTNCRVADVYLHRGSSTIGIRVSDII